ncbi:MAG: putative rane protein [Myxococcales bacterium]|jgi:predicted outer membrane protein|nr:putative rane protein [Myxococcales bacterium]
MMRRRDKIGWAVSRPVYLLMTVGMIFTLALTLASARAADLSIASAAILQDLHRSNQEGMAMGRLAQQKGFTVEMRRFGDILFYDHRSAERKVVKLAKSEGVQLGAVLSPERPLPTGKAFDAAFAEVALADHQKDVAAVEEAINSTTDKRLQRLLTDELSMLQKHVDIAQKILTTQPRATTSAND